MMNQFKGAKVAYVIFALVIFGLVCNILYIGSTGKHLVSGAEIEAFSKTRGKVEDILYAKRGEILSSDGEVIANNVKKYKLFMYTTKKHIGLNSKPDYVQDVQKTAELIADIINMDVTEMAVKLQEGIDSGKYQVEFGSYGNNLSSIVVDKIKDTGLPGIDFTEWTSRNYPMGDFASYIVGYAQTVENKSTKAIVGKMGLEKKYEEDLAGTNGYRVYQVDANNNRLPNGLLDEQKAVDGNNIYLTINASLQRDLDIQFLETAKAVDADVATCVLMEAKTGKILGMSNYPSFNPNERDIQSYQNFFFEQQYECGSVFKPFVYANVIDDGKYDGNATYKTGSYKVYDNVTINDWKPAGWGMKTFDEGLALSSNTGIANLIDHYADRESLIADYYKLGFFTKSETDSFSSPAGIAAFENTKGKLEFITTGYGQGSTVTPLQILRAYSVFANNGKTVEPYFIDRIVNPNTNKVEYTAAPKYSKQIFEPETITKMNALLLNNLESIDSVAKPYRLDGDIKFMGKTGTGQVPSSEGGYRTDKYSMSFVGLAPAEDPEIIIFSIFQCPDNDGTATRIGNFIKSMVPTALATNSSYTESKETKTNTAYEVDSFINQSVNYVKSKLEAKKINVEVIGSGTTVVKQFPEVGTAINEGDRIFIRTESSQITIPNMTGWSRKDVMTYASLGSLKIQTEGETGRVISQSIPEGTVANIGETFSVTLQ